MMDDKLNDATDAIAREEETRLHDSFQRLNTESIRNRRVNMIERAQEIARHEIRER